MIITSTEEKGEAIEGAGKKGVVEQERKKKRRRKRIIIRNQYFFSFPSHIITISKH